MKATYIKTQLQTIINVSKVVTIHDYEFDKNFVLALGVQFEHRFHGGGICCILFLSRRKL